MAQVRACFVIGAMVGLGAATTSARSECRLMVTGHPAFAAPVDGAIDVGMGVRVDPLLGRPRQHDGVDYARAMGTPVRASASGLTISAAYSGEYGNRVDIAHGSGWVTSYSHLRRAAAMAGDCIRAGDVIGWIGSTGLSAGPHLHFEIRKDDQPIDPETMLNSSPQ